ncbi:MAG: HDIG domain-containing metalloprotein [Bacteroidota bacterium]
MSENSTSYWSTLPDVAKYLLVFLVIMFISYLFPNRGQINYIFKPGQAWSYEDLIAPFDFDVYKTDAELADAVRTTEQNLSPYYQFDLLLIRQQKQAFQERFNEELLSARNEGQYVDVLQKPDRYRQFGNGLIDHIYEQGIIQLQDTHRNKGATFTIQIQKGLSTKSQAIGELLDEQAVKNYITDSLFNSGLQEAEFLLPIIEPLISANVQYSDSLTNWYKNETISRFSQAIGKVREGELIIARGEQITPGKYQRLESMKKAYDGRAGLQQVTGGLYLGYFLLTGLIVGLFIGYLRSQRPSIFEHMKELTFMLMWLVVYSYLVYVIEVNLILSAYMIPFCIMTIIIQNFYDERLALLTHIVVVLIASFLSSQGYEFTFLQMMAGVVVVISQRIVRDMSNFFLSMLYLFLAYAIGYFGLGLIRTGTLQGIDWSIYQWLFVNVFLCLLAYPLIPLLGRVFGYINPITLTELGDMNRPLLKEMSLKAPGTLQHSLQVANLSEAAAIAIGADALLVKVAALYHDIGKMMDPLYFIENQSGHNPHDQLDERSSAIKIIDHVTQGVAMAKKQRLPEVLIDFIRSHHGTTRTEYFYRRYVEKHGEALEVEDFHYPGPLPKSKEETILMLADSIEAATKSLQQPGEADIENLVEKIVNGKIERGQLEASALTFQDLESCKRAFRQLLKSIHHLRIEYPEVPNNKA